MARGLPVGILALFKALLWAGGLGHLLSTCGTAWDSLATTAMFNIQGSLCVLCSLAASGAREPNVLVFRLQLTGERVCF